MKNAMQLKQLIRNLAKDSNIEAEVLLRSFMMERFLERVALSDYKHNFILKGGVLIASMIGVDARTTKDIDVAIKGYVLSKERVVAIVEELTQVPVADEVKFLYVGIEEIREESDYPCFRVKVDATFDRVRQVLKIDISAKDFIAPAEIEYSYQLLFEDRAINLLAYNLELVLAEKFETIIARGTVNTRMRDFYDIYALTAICNFDEKIFSTALERTAKNRDTADQVEKSAEIIAMLCESPIMANLWERYKKKYPYAADISWDMVMSSVRDLANCA